MRSAAKKDGLTGTQAFADADKDAYSWLAQYAPDYADTVSCWYVADGTEKALAAFAAEKARLLADDETCTAYLWEGDAAEVRGLLTDGGKWQEFSQGVPEGTSPRVLIVLKK